MACPCSEKTAKIRCAKCQKVSRVTFTKGESLLAAAARTGKKCPECQSTEFTLIL